MGRRAASHRPRAPSRRGRAEPRRAVRRAERHARGASPARNDHGASTPAKRSPTSCFRSGRPRRSTATSSQLKRLVRDGMPTIILCDNEGQAERLDELLSDDDRGRVAGRAVDRRARTADSSLPAERDATSTRLRDSHRPRDLPPRAPHSSRAPLHHGDGARHGLAQDRRLRRAPRARRRHLSRHRDDLRRPEHDRGRGRRVRGRRPAQRPAVSHRPARALSLGERRLRGRAAAAPAPARRTSLGAAARARRASRFRR